MKLKRLTAAVILSSIAIASTVSAADFANTCGNWAKEYDDVKGHWAEDYIKKAYVNGLIDGVSDTEFNPDAQVTRGEFLKMAMMAAGIDTAEYRDGECLDAFADDWYSGYLQGALDRNIIPDEMTGGITFEGDKPITREEMAAIAVSCFGAAYENVNDRTPMYLTSYGCVREDAYLYISSANFMISDVYRVENGTEVQVPVYDNDRKETVELSAEEIDAYLTDIWNSYINCFGYYLSDRETVQVPTDGSVLDLGEINALAYAGYGQVKVNSISSDAMSDWAKPYIKIANGMNIMCGVGEELKEYTVESASGSIKYQTRVIDFAPNANATRAEATVVMLKLYGERQGIKKIGD